MTLSVAMCTFDGAAHVAEQLESLANQSRLPDELVVCDDGSSDPTVDIVRRFAADAPFPVRLHLNTVRLGSTKNFENAASRCAGEIIALCDQDDYWLPSKLACVEAAFQRPEVGLVFSDAEVAGPALEATGHRLWRVHGFSAAIRNAIHGDGALDVLLAGGVVTGATMAFRATFRELVFPIPLDQPLVHDGWIAALVSGVAMVDSLDEPLMRYRQHPAQQIGARPSPPREPGVRAALARVNAFDEQIAVAARVHERLTSQSRFRLRPGVEMALVERLRHLRARAALPDRAVARVRPVLGELVSGRYARYSNGVLSAAKDLWAGVRTRRDPDR